MSIDVHVNAASRQYMPAARGHFSSLDRALLRIHSGVMVRKLAIFFALLAVGWAAILSRQLAASILGTIVVGAMFAHGVELTHQFLHGTGFHSRVANRVAGVLCAMPMLVSHSHYRASHLAHHRDLGTARNREFFNYGNVRGQSLLFVIARSFSLARYIAVARSLLAALLGREYSGVSSKRERRAIRREYLAMVVLLIAIVAFTVGTGSDLALRLWLIPLLLVAEPIHFWVELPEHFGCDLNSRNALHNTRTIRGSWISFWFTNGNNFHVEHHLYPRLAIDKLPRIHATLRDELRNFNQSYGAFLSEVLTRAPSGTPTTPPGASAARAETVT